MRHGDLLATGLKMGDSVLIIDGNFHQERAVRHKEILVLLDAGVSVHGCSSLGALRAAELCRYGMVGHGTVFARFRSGELEGDDEVAVAQASADDVRAVSVPMVRVREWVALAAETGVLGGNDRAAEFIDTARNIYYPLRSMPALTKAWRGVGHDGVNLCAWLTSMLGRDARFGDVKWVDAVGALRALPQPGQHLASDRYTSERDLGPWWRTPLVNAWSDRYASAHDRPSHRERVLYQQVFGIDFSSHWREYMEILSLDESLRLVDRLHTILPYVRPANIETASELWCPQLPTSPGDFDVLLRDESAADVERLVAYLQLWRWDLARESGPSDLSALQIEHALSQIWGVPRGGLGREARARGFASREDCLTSTPKVLLGHLYDQHRRRAREEPDLS
ncbi:TfuA domain-containing protein [Nocardioides carbamazepini]|uniref:TfuA domain-containing protein n=1 Tax=Nocardioides carbamazepini TaxID=2854259 RepID=UPI002149F85F|nr:TfuA domain-containing protein [Nocardioides carbamazepini]MCR1785885.1 TfuA domain-containing protein [Nocardioides carbamazepini]